MSARMPDGIDVDICVSCEEVERLRSAIEEALYVMPWGDSEVFKARQILRKAVARG